MNKKLTLKYQDFSLINHTIFDPSLYKTVSTRISRIEPVKIDKEMIEPKIIRIVLQR